MRWCTKRTFRWLQGAFASQSQCCGISLYARSSYLPEKICSISVNENHADIHMDSKFNSKRAEQCFEPSTRQVTEAKRLFELLGPKSVLQGSALKPDDSPKLRLPEVAFVGRTSVGKSSLINALLHHKKLARTSKSPGHTRLINHFNIGSRFYLVDLPGYGYVKGKRDSSSHFVKVAERYLKHQGGRQLRSVCLLIDGKVGIKKNDLIAVEMLDEFATPYQVVLTKMDQVATESHQFVTNEVFNTIQKYGSLCFPHLFPISAKDKSGLPELRCFIATSVGAVK